MHAVQPMTASSGKATSDVESGSEASEEGHAPITDGDEWRDASTEKRSQAGRLAAGTILRDTYRIEALIATGGMANVYKATQMRLQGHVAIKVLHHDLLTEGEAMTRFRSEATMMGGLHHPHIVQVFDFNVMSDGTPYFAMELAQGPDLRCVLTERRVLSPVRVAHIVRQTASALGAAHAQGIIHRDLKPENVILVALPGHDDGQNECVKVVDFGISKQGGERAITVPSVVIGTPAYMAPEQARGLNDEVDHRTDQYALGALAYTLLTGREPFRAGNAVSVLYQVVHEEAAPLWGQVDWPCSHIEAVLRRAMAKNRDDRFPDVVAFARAFDDALALDLAADPHGLTATPLPLPSHRPGLAFAPTNDGRHLPDDGEPESAYFEQTTSEPDTCATTHAPVNRTALRRRRAHSGWRRALLVAGAAAAMTVAAEQGTWQGPGRIVKACGALSQGASHLLDRARARRPREVVGSNLVVLPANE